MCILNLFIIFFSRTGISYIILSIRSFNIFCCHSYCFICYSCGIRTQIRDHTNRSLSLNIDSFVKLLSQPHGLWCRKIQHLGSFLLQSTGSKRKRCFLSTFSFFHICHRKCCILQSSQHLIHLFSGVNLHLFFGSSIKFCRHWLLLTSHLKLCIQAPILFRYKCIDLFFPVCNDPERCRLYTACT